MRLDSFCTYAVENVEFLDTPVHLHVHVVTMHEYKTIIYQCTTSYGFTHIKIVQNATQVRFFSSRAHEFLNRENHYKGTFAM